MATSLAEYIYNLLRLLVVNIIIGSTYTHMSASFHKLPPKGKVNKFLQWCIAVLPY